MHKPIEEMNCFRKMKDTYLEDNIQIIKGMNMPPTFVGYF